MDKKVLIDDLRHAAEIIEGTDVHHRRTRFVEALDRHADEIEASGAHCPKCGSHYFTHDGDGSCVEEN